MICGFHRMIYLLRKHDIISIPAGTDIIEKSLCHSTKAFFMADPKGFEPLTFWSVARRSIQLS